MKIFITGATGFIGGRLAAKLIEQGHSVTCLVRKAAKATALRQLGATLAQGDIGDRASMFDAMNGADAVFHLAAWYAIGIRDRERMRRVNVEGVRNVLELAVELGIPKIIYTSTVAVFGNTHGQIVDEMYHSTPRDMVTQYDLTKWAAHYRVAQPMQENGAAIIIVQPGGVTAPDDAGPLAELYDFYFQKLPVMFGAKSGITWAHVDDIVDGHILAMEKGKIGESYILAGPSLTYKQAMEMWQPITGIRAPRFWTPGWMAAALSNLMDVIQLSGLRTRYTSEALREFADITYFAKSDKAIRELDWQPRAVEDTFKETLEHVMAQRKR